MRQAPSSEKVDFDKVLETSTQRRKDYLNDLLSLAGKVDPKQPTRIPKPEDPLQRAIVHFKDAPEPVHAMHQSMRDLNPRMNHFKQILFDTNRNGFPDDLSGFYKVLRDHENVFFGDLVAGVVNDLYTFQPKETYPITTQMLYIQSLSRLLFQRVKPLSVIDEASLRYATFNKDKRKIRQITGDENRMVRLERMLKDDFDFLATMQICSDYVERGMREAGAENTHYEWPYPRAGADIEWIGRPGKKTTAIYDIPGLKLVSDYFMALPKDSQRNMLQEYGDTLTDMNFLQYFVLLNAAWNEMRGQFFTDENIASLDSIPKVDWESLHLAREVPSCQKIFFENNKQPFFVTVDPAYDKTYLAAMSITDLQSYMELENKLKSPEQAREVVSPLRRPFVVRSYSNADSFSFLLRKDGKLSTYGDTNSIPRAQLGDHYDRVENFAHSVIKNLCHTDYVPGADVVPPNEPVVPGPGEPLHGASIPDEPVPRSVPPEETAPSHLSREFHGRREHSRLLPSGWMPGFEAWQRARSSESIDLYAEIFDETGKNPIESFKLDLSDGDFQKFRNMLLGYRVQHGDKIRFETFVSRATGK